MSAETSDRISEIAGRGMNDPASLTLDEIRSVCASAVRQDTTKGKRKSILRRIKETLLPGA